jgi:Flp pilus assembly protein TadG
MLRHFIKDESGMSFMEAAILFPVLFSLIMAVYDLGQGVIVNQKTVMASQVIADLVTRYEVLDAATVNDIVTAGELSLEPYPKETFGYDIASVEFDEDGDPVILWRMTENMSPDEDAINSTDGLGTEGEGVVVVSVNYKYVPYFSNFVFDEIRMNERAFLRGRKSTTVICDDC